MLNVDKNVKNTNRNYLVGEILIDRLYGLRLKPSH